MLNYIVPDLPTGHTVHIRGQRTGVRVANTELGVRLEENMQYRTCYYIGQDTNVTLMFDAQNLLPYFLT